MNYIIMAQKNTAELEQHDSIGVAEGTRWRDLVTDLIADLLLEQSLGGDGRRFKSIDIRFMRSLILSSLSLSKLNVEQER